MCIFNLLKALVYIENALGELLLFLRVIKMMKNVVKKCHILENICNCVNRRDPIMGAGSV